MSEKYINQVKLINFKRFENFTIPLSKDRNVLVGDNESGKSSVLLAIDLVVSGNISRVEGLGIDNLINTEKILQFLSSDIEQRKFANLPRACIELYLSDFHNHRVDGEANSEGISSHGLRMEIIPRDDLMAEIDALLENEDGAFPFEFYQVQFRTFANESYTGYSRFLRCLSIDNTQISSEYAMRSYVKNVYDSYADSDKQNMHKYQYRQSKKEFGQTHLSDINEILGKQRKFELRQGGKSTLENDLTISEYDIQIDNMGKGRQCLVRTEFALARGNQNKEPDIILLEEPENHLSHGNMSRLVGSIIDANDSQLVATTHSSLFSARLDLRNAIFLNNNSSTPILLSDLSEDTAKFFSKAPITNVLEFSLSAKVILVEGAAEFILLAAFYKNVTGQELSASDTHIVSVGGLSFKRYLELAKKLGIKVAVITDNDKDYSININEKYKDYLDDETINIYTSANENTYTFELCVYESNAKICDGLFSANLRNNTVPEYMLANKSEVAYQLLLNKGDELTAPDYIEQAITWISA